MKRGIILRAHANMHLAAATRCYSITRSEKTKKRTKQIERKKEREKQRQIDTMDDERVKIARK